MTGRHMPALTPTNAHAGVSPAAYALLDLSDEELHDMMSAKKYTLLSALALLACTGAMAQDVKSKSVPNPAHASMETRLRVAASIKESVQTYFAHWQAVPELDFDQAFNDYLAQIATTDDRRQFDLATMALIAKLENGHTNFRDTWLTQQAGPRAGLVVDVRDDQWVVINSHRPSVPAGSIITSVDGVPIETFYAQNRAYIAASTERARRGKLFNYPELLPLHFKLGLSDGKVVTLDRSEKPGAWNTPPVPKTLPAGVGYTAIPNFGEAHFEEDAVSFIKSHANDRTLIIDVRGNGGGNTPSKLLDALIVKPYTNWAEMSAMSVGLLKTYGAFVDQVDAKDDPEFHGFADGMQSYFKRPMLYAPGSIVRPGKPLFTGKLIVLVDQNCASACEDLVMPLKATQRAVIIGDTTYGSSGQPKSIDFGQGMSLRVGAKRMLFGDDSKFEGVGIEPDIRIVPTPAQLTANIDPVLERALLLASGEDAPG